MRESPGCLLKKNMLLPPQLQLPGGGLRGRVRGVVFGLEKGTQTNRALQMAIIYVGLGEKDKAFEWLEGLMRNAREEAGLRAPALDLTQCTIRCARTRASQTCSGG